jgi:hypothetical protein
MNENYLRALRPKKDPISFMWPGRCNGLWLDKDSKGCGHVVRIHYMASRKAHPRAAVCPICGQQYPFAFYKLKGDRDYVPSEEEERDIRLLHADVQRMAKGKDPSYDLPLEERIRIHSLAPPKE